MRKRAGLRLSLPVRRASQLERNALKFRQCIRLVALTVVARKKHMAR